MSEPFQFKSFRISQSVNAQKVGTDSMLLGSWSTSIYHNILDIGTGTGILALMLAQLNPSAKITAIEPVSSFLEEAIANFSASAFSDRITAINSSLQNFTSLGKFDLIISNPPYFENSSRSKNESKNAVRHTDSLPLNVLYKSAKSMLAETGHLNLVFPYEMEQRHFSEAEKAGLYPHRILRTLRQDTIFKRTLVSFSSCKTIADENQMIVKFADNSYSAEYIEMTKVFYGKDLRAKPK